MKRKTKKKLTTVFLILPLLLAGMNYILFGFGKAQTGEQNAPAGLNFTELVLQSLVFLGFIILLIYGIVYFLKKVVYKNHNQQSSHAFEILSITPLIPKKSLCVVKMVDRILVLGLTETGISPVTQIDNPDQRKEWETAFKNPVGANATTFATHLSKLLRVNKN